MAAIQKAVLAESASSVLSFAEQVLGNADASAKEKHLKNCREWMLAYAQLETELELSEQALNEVKGKMVSAISSDVPTDLREMADLVQRCTTEKMAAAGDLSGHRRCRELEARIEEFGVSTAAAGDELIVTQEQVAMVDPWSKQRIREPYKNRRCGHLYDRSSLASVLGKRSRKPVCPHVGCSNKVPLRWDDLEEDAVTRRVLENRGE